MVHSMAAISHAVRGSGLRGIEAAGRQAHEPERRSEEEEQEWEVDEKWKMVLAKVSSHKTDDAQLTRRCIYLSDTEAESVFRSALQQMTAPTTVGSTSRSRAQRSQSTSARHSVGRRCAKSRLF
jgi:hypothetical protein